MDLLTPMPTNVKLKRKNKELIITICGSVIFFDLFVELKKELLKMGFTQVLIPIPLNKKSKPKGVEDGKRKIELDLINKHYKKILQSSCVLVVNENKDGVENYIGGNTFLEMGFAFVNKKPIFLYNPIPNMKYEAEIIGMQPLVINRDLSKISQYLSDTISLCI